MAYKTLDGLTGIGLTIFDAVQDLAETERREHEKDIL